MKKQSMDYRKWLNLKHTYRPVRIVDYIKMLQLHILRHLTDTTIAGYIIIHNYYIQKL